MNREGSKLEANKRRYLREKKIEYDYSAKDWEDALKFFNYRDAYTGLRMNKPTKDHVIPVTALGGTVRENIVPCESIINSSKKDFHILDWYKQQSFFSQERLDKIIEWMGEYSKYIYDNTITETQPEYIGTGTLYSHRVPLPNGKVKGVYYPYHSDPRKRTLTIKREILDDWEDYCNDNWISYSKQGFGKTPEDKVKTMLDNCATYLLVRHKDKPKDYEYFEYKDIKKINDNEIHLDSFLDDSLKGDYIEDTLNTINKILKDKYKEQGVILYSKEKREAIEKSIASRKRTNIDKFNDIYGIENRHTYKYESKNKPFMANYWESTKVKVGKKGLIDNKRSYNVAWSTVNTLNEFNFNNKKYKIDDCIKGYSKQWRNSRYDDYRDDYKMEKVLCYEQDGRYYFFDQNIDRIPNKYITKL